MLLCIIICLLCSGRWFITYITLVVFFGGFVAFTMSTGVELDICDYLFAVIEVKFICMAVHFMECRDKHNLVRMDQINQMNDEL